MRSATSWWIIAVIIFLLDLYVFQALKTVSQQGSERGRQAIFITYWVVSFFTIVTMLSFPYLQFLQTSIIFRNYVFAILIGLFLAKLIGSLFFVEDDIRRGALVLMNKIFKLSGAQYMDLVINTSIKLKILNFSLKIYQRRLEGCAWCT